MFTLKKMLAFISHEMYNVIIALSYVALFLGSVLICPLGYEVAKMGSDPYLLFAPGLMVVLGMALFFFGLFSKIARGEREEALAKAMAEREYKRKLMGLEPHESPGESHSARREDPILSPSPDNK